jgi:hypothetical protein
MGGPRTYPINNTALPIPTNVIFSGKVEGELNLVESLSPISVDFWLTNF